jgi:hypothetical protein
MKHLILVILLFLNSPLYSQEYKRNYNWGLGYDPVVKFNFDNNSLFIQKVENNSTPYCILIDGASISDSNGNLLFISNGFVIYDSNGYCLQNGYLINCPLGKKLANRYGGVTLTIQTSIILPKSGNQYYLFSTGMSDSVASNYINGIYAEFDVLSYCVVDMDSNNGKGKVIVRDSVLAQKRHFGNAALSAVKHANGKDWWLVKSDCHNNRFEEYLVTANSIKGPFFYEVTSKGDWCYDFFSTMAFNHAGTQLVSGMYGMTINGIYYRNRVDLYDFNRCDGSIVFKQYYLPPYDISTYPTRDMKNGLCFSPNDSLLYEINDYTIYQIDIHDTNRYNALFIHGPDTLIEHFPLYQNAKCGPDGKLYIGNQNGTRKYMSYIDKPNMKGVACDFMPQGIYQPYTNLKSPPNMPNYGLGPDTLRACLPVEPTLDNWLIYPNPCSSVLYIKFCSGQEKVLYNTFGQKVLSTTDDELFVGHLPRGLYYLSARNRVKKVVVE